MIRPCCPPRVQRTRPLLLPGSFGSALGGLQRRSLGPIRQRTNGALAGASGAAVTGGSGAERRSTNWSSWSAASAMPSSRPCRSSLEGAVDENALAVAAVLKTAADRLHQAAAGFADRSAALYQQCEPGQHPAAAVVLLVEPDRLQLRRRRGGSRRKSSACCARSSGSLQPFKRVRTSVNTCVDSGAMDRSWLMPGASPRARACVRRPRAARRTR